MRRMVLFATIMFASLFSGAVHAGAQTGASCGPNDGTPNYPPLQTIAAPLTISNSSAVSGESVTISGTGFRFSTPASTVNVAVNGATVREGIDIVQEDGTFSLAFNLPAGLGTNPAVVAVGGVDGATGCARVLSGVVNLPRVAGIVQTTVPTVSGPLGFTGANSTDAARVGLLLVSAGGLLVFVAKRRRLSIAAPVHS